MYWEFQLPVVAAAGLGKRFGVTSDNRPKWAVEVKGSPLLSYLFSGLASIGFKSAVVLTRAEQIEWVHKCQQYVPALRVEPYAGGTESQYAAAISALEIGVSRQRAVILLSADMLANPDDLKRFAREFGSGADGELWCLVARQPHRTSASWRPVIGSKGSVLRLNVAQGGFYERTALAIDPKTAMSLLAIAKKSRDNFGLGWTVTALIELARRSGFSVRAIESDSLVANLNEPSDVSKAELVVEKYFAAAIAALKSSSENR